MSSTKSSTGHLLGAFRAVESIFSILAIKNNIIPPTLNLENPSLQSKKINLVPNSSLNENIDCVLTNSLDLVVQTLLLFLKVFKMVRFFFCFFFNIRYQFLFC